MGDITMTETPWNTKAKEYGTSEIGAHSDAHLVELENEFIERHLKRIQPENILDVGCGNGQRTKRWEKYAGNCVIGIDSSNEMIKLATELTTRKLRFANFDIRDIEQFDKDNLYDCIISARCLINLPTERDQINAIDLIYDALKPGGYFICCEGREMGTQKLNEMREKFGIEHIKVNALNLDLSGNVISHTWNKFDDIEENTLGLYYFITRVLTQIKTMDLNEAAKRLQLEYGDELGICALGRHFCFCGRKE
jgi:SAM-dependent methyltransferase